jgi:hypothetical protein
LNLSDKFYLIEENLTVSINFGGVQHWLSGLYRILEVGIQIRATAIVELTLLRIPNYSNEAEMSSGNVAEEDVGNLGINRSTNWYMTGPNISNNGEMTWSQISGNRWTGDYLAINKLMPTIALHYIKRVSNPW